MIVLYLFQNSLTFCGRIRDTVAQAYVIRLTRHSQGPKFDVHLTFICQHDFGGPSMKFPPAYCTDKARGDQDQPYDPCSIALVECDTKGVLNFQCQTGNTGAPPTRFLVVSSKCWVEVINQCPPGLRKADIHLAPPLYVATLLGEVGARSSPLASDDGTCAVPRSTAEGGAANSE